MAKEKLSDEYFINCYKRSQEIKILDLAKELGIGRSTIYAHVAKGRDLMKHQVTKTDTKVVEAGVNGLTLEQIAEIQEKNKSGTGQEKLSKEYGVSRYRIQQALQAKVEEHANDVVSATIEKVGYDALRIGVVVKWGDSNRVIYARDGIHVFSIPVNDKKFSVKMSAIAVAIEKHSQRSGKTPEYEVLGGNNEIANVYDLACRIVEHRADFVLNDGRIASCDEDANIADIEEENVILAAITDPESEAEVLDYVSIWDISVSDTLANHGLETVSSVDAEGFKDLTLKTEEHIGDKLVAEDDKYQVMILPNQITIVGEDNVPQTVPNGHPNFQRVLKAVKEKAWDMALKFINVRKSVETMVEGLFELKEGKVLFEGLPIGHEGFTSRILSMATEGDRESVERAARFVNKVMENPSNQIVRRIYDFMKFADVEIADDGDLYAYKAVTGNYLDCHSRSIKNTPGSVVTMRRNRVNENDEQTCSYGLHVCALSYLPSYSGSSISSNRIVRVKLNPADIVSIPTDYKDAKIRCCRYEVVNDVSQEYRQGKLKIDRDGIFQY